MNPLLKPAQVGLVLADCDLRALVTTPERLPLLRDELKAAPALHHVALVSVPATRDTPCTPGRRKTVELVLALADKSPLPVQ